MLYIKDTLRLIIFTRCSNRQLKMALQLLDLCGMNSQKTKKLSILISSLCLVNHFWSLRKLHLQMRCILYSIKESKCQCICQRVPTGTISTPDNLSKEGKTFLMCLLRTMNREYSLKKEVSYLFLTSKVEECLFWKQLMTLLTCLFILNFKKKEQKENFT